MESGRLSYKGIVYPWHCDHMGHMNVMWYVGKYDEATWSFFGNLGLSATFLENTNKGMAAIDQHILYKKECMPGDMLEIYTRPLGFKTKSISLKHEMINCGTGEVVSTCELVAVHIDCNTRKGVELPKDTIENITLLLAS
jgi:acyl-CoA thioester hydrolase